MRWNHYPLIRSLLALIAGILTFLWLPEFPTPSYWLFLVPLLCALFFVFYRKSIFQFRFSWIFGVFIFLFFFLLGWKITENKTNFIGKHHFSNISNAIAYCGFVEEEPVEKARSWKSTLRIQYVRDEQGWIATEGKLLCYFAKDSLNAIPKISSTILFFTHPEPIPPVLNPAAFDYRTYLQHRSIGHRVYLTTTAYKKYNGSVPFSLFRFAQEIQHQLVDILRTSRLTAKEFGIASAILLGYSDMLDPEMRMLYANVGAAHILCVSGMHVGVIFMIFSFCLSFLNKTKRGRRIRSVILLLLIWSYAFITGLAPAVTRSSIMISCLVVSQMIGRKHNSWNAIFSSAFFMLLINPFLIVDVGFQLSYSAVIAILALQKFMYGIYQARTWLGDKIWAIASVSLVAQIGTAPISIFYFHQFPNWFLLTNLLVIPASSIVIYTGVAVLCFSQIAILKTWLGTLLFLEIKFLNKALEWINNLPCSIISAININLFEVIFVLVITILTTIFLQQRQKRALLYLLISILLLCMSTTIEKIQHQYQKEFVVFEAGKSPVLGFVHGRNMTIITDSIFCNNDNVQSFVIKDFIIRQGIRNVRFEKLTTTRFYDSSTGLYCYGDNLLFHHDKIIINDFPLQQQENPFYCDYLIIRNNFFRKPEEFLESFSTQTVLLDGSNSNKMQHLWCDQNDSLQVQLYILPQRGAMVKHYKL